MYVFTKKAEERAKELGVEPRIAGTQAMCGYEPVFGLQAKAWLEKGYIEEVEDEDGDSIQCDK